MTLRSFISWMLLGAAVVAIAWVWRDVRRAEAEEARMRAEAARVEALRVKAAEEEARTRAEAARVAALRVKAAEEEARRQASMEAEAEQSAAEEESWLREEEARRERERAVLLPKERMINNKFPFVVDMKKKEFWVCESVACCAAAAQNGVIITILEFKEGNK